MEPAPRATLSDWLTGAKFSAPPTADDAAKLFPLLGGLPPPHARPPLPLQPLPPSALRSFELRPTAKPPAPAAAAAGDAAASSSAAAADAKPADDLRLQIWQLAHKAYDAFSGEWPHTWAKPAFAQDPQQPKPEEWMHFAEQLSKSSGCKAKLEAWRDAAGTPPLARDALRSLIERLGLFVRKSRERAAKAKEQRDKQDASELAARDAELEQRERELSVQSLQQRYGLQIGALQREIGELEEQQRKKKRGDDGSAREMEIMQKQMKIAELQAQFAAEMAGAGGGGAMGGADAAGGGAGGQRKRARR